MEEMMILGVREANKALYVDVRIKGKGFAELYVSKKDVELCEQFRRLENQTVMARYEMGVFDRKPYIRFTSLELVA